MSVIVEKFIVCDGCGYPAADLDRQATAAEQRTLHKAAGWAQIGSKDYCDECLAAGRHVVKSRAEGGA